ncbi:MAG: hypothetical protein J7L96_09270 [Bacteroidales bacterium]|nr:hypothetical protein [Bacteroidales bacterium]
MMKKFIPSVFSLVLLLALLSSCNSDRLKFTTDQLVITVDNNGFITDMINPQTNLHYTAEQEKSPIIQFRKDSVYYLPNAFSQSKEDGVYEIAFSDSDIRAKIRLTPKSGYFVFELIDIDQADDLDLIVWGPYANSISQTIGEIVGVVRDSSYALGIQALNIRTLGGFPDLENDQNPSYNIFETNSIVDVSDSVKVFYRGQTARRTEYGSVLQAYTRNRNHDRVIANWNHDRYTAPAFSDGGVTGSTIALFGTDVDSTLATISKIEVAEGLPHPVIDGEWGKTVLTATSSYLIMNFGEDNLDEAIDLTQKAGLKYLYHGGPFANWGHFDLNKKEFPDNWQSMKRCVDRAERAGLRLGLHTLSNFITTNDPYVTPIPDPRLAKVGSSTIMKDLPANETQIEITDPGFFNQMKNNTLHAVVVDNEIIRYRSVSESAPWILLDCERGAFGTQEAKHTKGTIISKLMDHGYRTFLTNAELSKEVALRIADLFNQTGLRQISFDGLEGNWSTGMGQYGRQLFVKYWYDALKPELRGKVITDASNPGHYFWHMYTRMNWGEPWYAGFRESQTQYRLLNQALFQRNLMPAMLGWFRMTAEISQEDIEWLLARAAGFDAGFALVTSPAVVKQHGMGATMLETINIWETARMAGAFTDELKPDLKDINQEFHLEKVGANAWNLFKAKLVKGKYKKLEKQPGEPNLLNLDFNNENPGQPLSLMLTAPSESGLKNIQIEIDGSRKIILPIDLPPKHHIKYTGGSYIQLYDAHWRLISSGRVIQDHYYLNQGQHKITFDAEFTGSDGEVGIELRTWGLPVRIMKNKAK